MSYANSRSATLFEAFSSTRRCAEVIVFPQLMESLPVCDEIAAFDLIRSKATTVLVVEASV